MAFIDFSQQSSLFNQPHHPNRLSDFLTGSTTRLAYDGDPSDDLEEHSVFIDIEDFMKSVLHVPADWRARWGPAIRAVKHNPDFMKHYLRYPVPHEKDCAEHEEEYEPLLLMNEAILRTAFPTVLSQQATPTPLPLSQLVHIVDDGPYDCIVDDGSFIPRLITEGECPPLHHTTPPGSLRQTFGEATSSSASENTRKRKRDSESAPERKKQRPGVTSAPSRVNPEINAMAHSPTLSQCQCKQRAEVGQLLLELLSLRPHVILCLVDRNRIQFYHANHTVVLVSPAITLSPHDDEGGIDRFIAVLIAFHRISLHNQTVLEASRNGMILRLQGNDKVEGPIEVELGRVISMSLSLVGRSTAVIYGTSPEWPNRQLVVKISWVDDFRVSEREFMDKAVEEAMRPGHEWALDHLPRFFYVEDVKDQTYGSVQELFKNARFVGREYTYERRQMRIVVQEPLDSLKALTNAKDIGQAMLDVACVHRWLYDHAGILHGDISFSNIMCRTIEGKVHGVLTDYDLSFWKASLTADHATSSQQATGTPPYMACGLLLEKGTTHRYRHDVESLFYVMLTMCGRHTIGHTGGEGTEARLRVVVREGKLPYQKWFETRGHTLGCLKLTYFWDMQDIESSPSFEGFRVWLRDLRWLFSEGFRLRSGNIIRGHRARKNVNAAEPYVPFDDETLGGCIDYSTLIEPVRHLTGELEGLVIRYDPTPYSLRVATNVVPSQ